MKLITFSLLLGLLFYCKPAQNQEVTHATVTFLKGESTLEQKDGSSLKLKLGDPISSGDVISTGNNSTLILALGQGKGSLELQSDSRFKLEKKGDEFELFLEKGKVWLMANKLQKNEGIRLSTEASVAAVRGTKFYTFIQGDMVATCHCEGQIEYKNKKSSDSLVNEEDYFIVQKKGKHIKITREDLKKAGIIAQHNHSELEDSSLGQKASLSKEESMEFFGLIEKKFKELEESGK